MLELNHKSLGAGKPVVIVHGLLGMLDNWQTFGRLLAESHLVFLVDLRNHGRSPHITGMSYKEMSEDLVAFMDEHWLHDEVSIIGHSMGGKVAMQLALDYPHRIANLMVVDIAPRAYRPSHNNIFSALRAINLSTAANRKDIEQPLLNDLKDPKVVGFLMKNLSRRPEGYRWKMNLDAIQNAYSDIIGAIQWDYNEPFEGPSSFYRGALSSYITDEDIPQIKQHFTNLDLVTVPNAGHWVHADNLEFLLASVRAKLDS